MDKFKLPAEKYLDYNKLYSSKLGGTLALNQSFCRFKVVVKYNDLGFN
jgi:hypothetical protein